MNIAATNVTDFQDSNDRNGHDVSYNITNLKIAANSLDYALENQQYTVTLALADNAPAYYYLPDSITVTVGGSPLTPGSHYDYSHETGVLTINADQLTDVVNITASALHLEIGVTENRRTPTKLDFGTMDKDAVNDSAHTKTVTVTNKGDRNVTVTLPTVPNFVVTPVGGFNSDTATIQPQYEATFTIKPDTLMPSSAPYESGAITVSPGFNYLGNASQSVSFTASVSITNDLEAPGNLAWDDTGSAWGTVTWDRVDHAAEYVVQLYKDNNPLGNAVTTADLTHAFDIAAAGAYTFKMKAAAPGTGYLDSAENESDKLYSVTYTLKNELETTGAADVLEGEEYTSEIRNLQEKFSLPDSIELTVGNQVPQAADYYSYSKDTGVIIIESKLVTAPLNITAAGVAGGTSESGLDIPGSGDADPSDPGSSPDLNPGSGNAGTGGGIAGGGAGLITPITSKPDSKPGTKPETGAAHPFTDVKEADWFYDSVAYVYAAELMNGVGETEFSSYGTTSRA